MLKAVGALRGSALKCWICWSRVHRRYSWDRFTTNLLWRFKPEWREIFPNDEEEEPHQELQLLHTKDSISQTSTIPLYQISALETLLKHPLPSIAEVEVVLLGIADTISHEPIEESLL